MGRYINKKTNRTIVANETFIQSLPDANDWEYIIEDEQTKTLDELKLEKIKLLHKKYEQSYQEYLNSYPKNEVDSFDDKKREALAWSADNTAPTPIIDSILTGLGEDKATYINSILAKVQYLAQKEGEMVKTRDAIKACTTQEELDAIVV